MLVSTSPRTRAEAAESLFAAISRPAFLHCWSENGSNPYLGLLAIANFLVVTGDSASMLSEACATGKPVYIFKLPERLDLRLSFVRFIRGSGLQKNLRSAVYDKLVEVGLLTSTREMAAFHEMLIKRGWAAELGAPEPRGTSSEANPLKAAADRIRSLYIKKVPTIGLGVRR